MLTFPIPANSIRLPKREPNIPLHLITFKEATGFLLWNNQSGAAARFFLMKFERADYPESPVARFFGGTAIPFPFSHRNSGMQSLIRLAEYLETDLPVNAGDDFIPLHRFSREETTVHEQVGVEGALTVSIPVSETHGLLPVDDGFIAAHRYKLEEVFLRHGMHSAGPDWVQTEHDLPFNDSNMVPILKHLLQQGLQPAGAPKVKMVINPTWATGNYIPYRDHPAT